MWKKLTISLFILSIILSVAIPSQAATSYFKLTWTDSIDRPYLTTYRIYYWPEGTTTETHVDAGLVTEYTIHGFADGQYCFALTAIDTRGLESVRTPSVCGVANSTVDPPNALILLESGKDP